MNFFGVLNDSAYILISLGTGRILGNFEFAVLDSDIVPVKLTFIPSRYKCGGGGGEVIIVQVGMYLRMNIESIVCGAVKINSDGHDASYLHVPTQCECGGLIIGANYKIFQITKR